MKKFKHAAQISVVIISIILILYAVAILLVLLWGLINSLKDYYEFRTNAIGLPSDWRFDNYSYALSKFVLNCKTADGGRANVYMPQMYLNSILYAGGSALTSAFIPCITSYVVARFKFKPLKIIYYIVIVCMVIPIVGSLPAQLRMATALGLKGHIWGMWIMSGHFLGLYFLVFYAAFQMLPEGFSEAARIDGAGNLVIMFRIMFPLVRTTFFTIFLLKFIEFWNDYQTPLLFIPDSPTIAIGLYYFDSSPDSRLSSVPLRLTGCMLVFIPIFLVFLAFHNKLMGNLSMGGLKE